MHMLASCVVVLLVTPMVLVGAVPLVFLYLRVQRSVASPVLHILTEAIAVPAVAIDYFQLWHYILSDGSWNSVQS